MTNRQREVLRSLAASIRRRGYSPTVRELCREYGWASYAAAQGHLNCLERDGYITRERNKARTIQLTDDGRKQLEEVAT